MEVFKYLGRLLAYIDDDSQAVRGNLKKACGVWARLSRTMWGRQCLPPCVRRVLQIDCAIDPTVWKRDMELVTGEFEMSGRVSYTSRLAYGRQEATETSGWYVIIPKFNGGS